jgi:hypothetical protein
MRLGGDLSAGTGHGADIAHIGHSRRHGGFRMMLVQLA